MRAGEFGKSLFLPLNFAVNLTLLKTIKVLKNWAAGGVDLKATTTKEHRLQLGEYGWGVGRMSGGSCCVTTMEH